MCRWPTPPPSRRPHRRFDKREAVGDRVKSGRLRHDAPVRRDVCAVDDLGEHTEGRIVEVVLEDDRLEAAAAVNVAQLDITS